MWWRILLLLAIAAVPALGAPAKPCQSIKSAVTCDDRADCAWVNVSQGKGKGNTNKCRPLGPIPR